MSAARKVEVRLDLLRHQAEFCFSRAKYPAIVGGLGSGKTKAGTVRAVLKLLEQRGNNIGFFLPTYDLLKLRAMPGVEEDLNALGLRYATNLSDFRIDVEGYGYIIFRSYDRPERIIAFQVAHSICDEIDTLPRDKAAVVWRKIAERTRQPTAGPNTIGAITSPDHGVSGFVYANWVKSATHDHHLIKARTTDNPFLPPDYAAQIASCYDPILADLYLNGEFVSLARNKVYSFFNRLKHHSGRVLRNSDRAHASIDFNIGGCCGVVWVIDGNVPIAVDEFVANDTQDFVNHVARISRTCSGVTVYPDASGRAARTNAALSDIQLIERAGYHVDAPANNPAVRDRINSINALLARDALLVNTDRCQNLTAALELQGYTDKGEPEKFNEHPSIDDWADSAGYFINRKFPISRPVVFTGLGYAR